MLKNIVVGTDGSSSADRAIDHAISLAKAFGATLTVVSAYKPVSGQQQREVAGEHLPGDLRHGVGPRDEVNQILDAAKAKAAEAGVEASVLPAEGDPVTALLDASKSAGADLIVVGNRGMQGARRVLGSVPNNISHHAECDVYIAQTT
jgi:nucleotide-binding universal stress UspA family protein